MYIDVARPWSRASVVDTVSIGIAWVTGIDWVTGTNWLTGIDWATYLHIGIDLQRWGNLDG